MTEDSKILHPLLKRAVVKVLSNATFRGTGFFITPRHLLTAYHCIEFADENNLFIKNDVYGQLRVLLDKEKSFPSREIDIAVLTLAPEKLVRSADYLPLGMITESHTTDTILAVGYPGEMLSFLSGEIHGFPEKYRYQFFNNVMKAEGQSGGPVYHVATQRVVGLALQVHQQEIMREGGLAGRFDPLFQQWSELEALNQQAIAQWERRLKEDKRMKLAELPPQWRYRLAGAILLIILVLIGIWLKPSGNDAVAIRAIEEEKHTLAESKDTQLGDPDAVRYYQEAGIILSNEAKYQQAEPLFEKALKITEQVSGKQHPDYALILDTLAELYEKQNKYEQALPLYQEALQILTNTYGEKDSATLLVAEHYQRCLSKTELLE